MHIALIVLCLVVSLVIVMGYNGIKAMFPDEDKTDAER